MAKLSLFLCLLLVVGTLQMQINLEDLFGGGGGGGGFFGGGGGGGGGHEDGGDSAETHHAEHCEFI
jgi:hypothetical protein